MAAQLFAEPPHSRCDSEQKESFTTRRPRRWQNHQEMHALGLPLLVGTTLKQLVPTLQGHGSLEKKTLAQKETKGRKKQEPTRKLSPHPQSLPTEFVFHTRLQFRMELAFTERAHSR